MPNSQRRLYALLLTNFTLFGVALTLLGATIPKIIETFSWSYTATGFVLAAGSIGYFVSTFLCGFLVQRVGSKRVLVGGLCIQGLGLLLFARHPSPYVNLLLNFTLGFGQGGSEVVTNYGVIRMEKPGESRLMSLMHGMFCVGAILGPVVLGSLLRIDVGWRVLYRVIAVGCVAMAAVFASMPFQAIDPLERQRNTKSRRILREPMLILSALIILLYVGGELGVSNWIAEYYVTELGASASNAAYMVSVLWAGLLCGRLALTGALGNQRPEKLLVWMGILCTVFLFAALAFHSPGIVAVLIFLTGLGYSGIYPIVMALVGHYFSENQGVASGFVSTGGGIGALLFPFPVAFLGDRWGLHTGLLFCAFVNSILFIFTLLVYRRSKAPVHEAFDA